MAHPLARPTIVLLVALVCVACSTSGQPVAHQLQADLDYFNTDVYPILDELGNSCIGTADSFVVVKRTKSWAEIASNPVYRQLRPPAVQALGDNTLTIRNSIEGPLIADGVETTRLRVSGGGHDYRRVRFVYEIVETGKSAPLFQDFCEKR